MEWVETRERAGTGTRGAPAEQVTGGELSQEQGEKLKTV